MFDPEYLLRLLSGALTPLIAIIAVYIAYQQFLTNQRKTESDARFAQSKQRFDLYERRLSVFNATMDLIAAVHRRPFDKLYEPLVAFHKAIAESYFLFDQDLLDYLEVFKNKYVDSTISPGPTETAAFYKWFGEQFDEARKRFSKYLSLRELGTPSI